MEGFIYLVFLFFVIVFVVACVVFSVNIGATKEKSIHADDSHIIKMRMDDNIYINEKVNKCISENENIRVLIFIDIYANIKLKINDRDFFVSSEIEIKNISDLMSFSVFFKELSESKREKELFDHYGI